MVKMLKPTHQPKWKTKLRMHGTVQKVAVPEHLGTMDQLSKGKISLNIRENKTRLYSLRPQMIPIHDYINFKDMSSNEILLNLENH